MDTDWALEQLRWWLTLHERVPLPEGEARSNRKTRFRGTTEEREAADNVVWEIARMVYEEVPRHPRHVSAEYVRRTIWEIENGSEVRSHLGLQDPAPTIVADSLHPWVWDAAEPHWRSGNHDAAIWAAAINVNSRLQSKVDRKDVGESALLKECFSTDDPKPGRPRLRRCGPENPDLFKDMHRGPANFGQGLFAAVRNPLNHVTADDHLIGEAEALEALASLSLLARWIDQAEVVEVENS
ncbi:TIGR02391 family protein [Ruania rhizosphaerae]|uniref:TIGR02391 family protein n=1 Tax=Ruania rhizosphaerae TaxID=1840413 RepID=UPI00135B8686|nr:TIGR02391 family protein [Ruania rhizosphaerae]